MFCLKSTEVCLKEVRCFQFPKPIHPLGKKFCVFLLHSYTNSWKSVYTLGISGVGEGVGCCPGVGLILHFPSGYRISLINLDGRFLRKQTSLYINIMSKEYNVDVDDTLFKGSFTKENSYPYYPLSIFISLLLFLYHFTLLSAYILCDIK